MHSSSRFWISGLFGGVDFSPRNPSVSPLFHMACLKLSLLSSLCLRGLYLLNAGCPLPWCQHLNCCRYLQKFSYWESWTTPPSEGTWRHSTIFHVLGLTSVFYFFCAAQGSIYPLRSHIIADGSHVLHSKPLTSLYLMVLMHHWIHRRRQHNRGEMCVIFHWVCPLDLLCLASLVKGRNMSHTS